MDFIIENRILTLMNELKLARRGYKTEKSNIIIREVCIDIWNVYINELTGKDVQSRPDFAYMSKSFHHKWVLAGKTAKVMTRVGVLEHRIPMAVLRSKMVSLQKENELLPFLSSELKLVWISKDEDQILKKLGWNSTMPTCGSDRYDCAGIEVLPNPVKFKNIRLNDGCSPII